MLDFPFPCHPAQRHGECHFFFSTLGTLELGSVALSTPLPAQARATASILPNRIEVEVIVHETFGQQPHGRLTAVTTQMDDHGSGSSNTENEQMREEPNVRSLGDDVP
jgi:hypothetical protein